MINHREYMLKQIQKKIQIVNKGKLSDIDKLEYLIASINPYSHFWRLGMIRTLRKALVMMKGDYKKIVKAYWIPITDYPSWRHFQVY